MSNDNNNNNPDVVYKVQGHKGLIRDFNSKAILNVDRNALDEHRKKKRTLKQIYKDAAKIDQIEQDLNDVKGLVKDIFEQLNLISSKMNK